MTLPDWDKTGTKIKGNYLGEIPFTGMIENSRIKYGGDIEYRVRLLDMIEVYGDWRSVILIDREEDKDHYELIIEETI